MYAHIFKVYASHVNKSVYGLVIGAETGIPEYMAFLDVFGRQRDNERLEHSHMSTYPCVYIYILCIMRIIGCMCTCIHIDLFMVSSPFILKKSPVNPVVALNSIPSSVAGSLASQGSQTSMQH